MGGGAPGADEGDTMNTPIDDGGPAFPQIPAQRANQEMWSAPYVPEGMSLRDWFAGQAVNGNDLSPFDDFEAIACAAYKVADAMLAARKKTP